MRLGDWSGMVERMKGWAKSDVDVVDGIGGGVAEVRHGVKLTPLHMRTARHGFPWRLRACMHAIIGSRSSRFAFCGRRLADSALSLLRRRRLRPRL